MNGRTIAGTNLRDDATAAPADTDPGAAANTPSWTDPSTWYSAATSAYDSATGTTTAPADAPAPMTDPNAWIASLKSMASNAYDSIANAINTAPDPSSLTDLSTCQASYQALQTTAAQAKTVAKDSKWSLKKPLGIAVAGGAALTTLIIGVAIGRSRHSSGMSGRRRHRR